MNLLETLKQFKAIRPDSAYSETSKRALLAMTPATSPAWSARRTFLRIIETGVAVALTAFFVLLVTGGFLGSKLTPVKYSAIDPQGLRAEAQAIDIQIELANVKYNAPAATPSASAESTTPIAGASKNTASPKVVTSSSPLAIPGALPGTQASSSATSTSTLSIDQTLGGLSQ